MEKDFHINVLLHKKLWKAKVKNWLGKYNFCDADADVKADADADIFKWSRETTINYLGTQIQMQKI